MQRVEASDTAFAKAALKRLKTMSPLSLAVVFEQYKRGKSMDLKAVFEMEYGMFQAYMDHKNETEFFEGVRAQVVDKDRKPKWRHSAVSEVTQKEIDYFFNREEKVNLDISKYVP